MKRADISDAYARIRQINNTIPDDVLDFMKESAYKILNAQGHVENYGVLIQRESEDHKQAIIKSLSEVLVDGCNYWVKTSENEPFQIAKFNNLNSGFVFSVPSVLHINLIELKQMYSVNASPILCLQELTANK